MIARNTASQPASKSETKPAYRSPKLLEIGKSAKLLQGPMLNAPYYDSRTYGMSHWPN